MVAIDRAVVSNGLLSMRKTHKPSSKCLFAPSDTIPGRPDIPVLEISFSIIAFLYVMTGYLVAQYTVLEKRNTTWKESKRAMARYIGGIVVVIIFWPFILSYLSSRWLYRNRQDLTERFKKRSGKWRNALMGRSANEPDDNDNNNNNNNSSSSNNGGTGAPGIELSTVGGGGRAQQTDVEANRGTSNNSQESVRRPSTRQGKQPDATMSGGSSEPADGNHALTVQDFLAEPPPQPPPQPSARRSQMTVPGSSSWRRDGYRSSGGGRSGEQRGESSRTATQRHLAKMDERGEERDEGPRQEGIEMKWIRTEPDGNVTTDV